MLEYKHLKGGSKYTCRLIELEPDGRLNKLIQDISELYTGEKGKKRLSRYNDVRNYDGTCSGTTIYKIPFEESDVVVDLDALFEGITNSDVECNPFEIKPQAYILCGRLLIDGKEHQIKLISMNSPITILKNKFMNKKGKFKEIKEKILNLRTSINAVIYDKDIYMLDKFQDISPLQYELICQWNRYLIWKGHIRISAIKLLKESSILILFQILTHLRVLLPQVIIHVALPLLVKES